MSALKIYIVDDDQSIRDSLRDVLEDEDFLVDDFSDGSSMLAALKNERPALVLLDVWLGQEDGLELIASIKEIYPALPVLMISGHGTIEQAVAATKRGAVDFLEKPISIDNILGKINEILQLDEAKSEDDGISSVQLEVDEIIGQSLEITRIKSAIARAARTNARVLIYGENGSGKELVARAIYQNSRRRSEPFIEVNCAAIPEELIESELFGHEKGAFTGAAEMRRGRFELAHQGTLFLDEISDMSLATQATVLRAIQEQRFTRVGGATNIEVDVRIIAATNIRLEDAISEGRFREDLYYRLNVIPIDMPPLRDRRGDIPDLIEHFLHESIKYHQLEPKSFTSDAITELQGYDWPGNVRELKNFMERILIMTEAPRIDSAAAKKFLSDTRRRQTGESKVKGDLRSARDEFEKEYIIQALRENEKNISRTARFLGLERTNLHRKIKSYGIDIDKI